MQDLVELLEAALIFVGVALEEGVEVVGLALEVLAEL